MNIENFFNTKTKFVRTCFNLNILTLYKHAHIYMLTKMLFYSSACISINILHVKTTIFIFLNL
jgi:hypothetical protein